jgi:hypothetical protein
MTPAPLRYTDAEVDALVRALAEHGEGSPEADAALAVCAQRLADWVDDQVARAVYGELAAKYANLQPAVDAVDPSAASTGNPSTRD